jgi:hypothetical protein
LNALMTTVKGLWKWIRLLLLLGRGSSQLLNDL